MFVVSKLVAFLTSPLTVVLTLFALGVALHAIGWRRGAGLSHGLALLITAIIVLTPVSEAAMRSLEDRYPVQSDVQLDEIAGAIVLGGAQGHGDLVAERGVYALNSRAERLTTIVALRRLAPDLPVIVSGGSGYVRETALDEGQVTAMFLEEMGVSLDRLHFESRSKNTFENGRYASAAAEEIAPGGRWLLVTSAAHMPRSVEIFQHFGVDVIPYPVDFTALEPSWRIDRIVPLGRFSRMDGVLHEYLGLWYFRLLQRREKDGG